jgi:hypothetical protein
MSHATHILGAALVLLTAASCSKGYDQEIVLQLFRARTAPNDVVEVIATEGGVTRTFSSASDARFSFASCDNNKLRIIPKQVNGVYEPVTVSVKSGALSVPPVVIKVPTDTVKLVLGSGPDLVPTGSCAPTVPPDGGPGQKAIGVACKAHGECAGSFCLTTADTAASTTPLNLPDGYCTQDCKSTPCADGFCRDFNYPIGTLIGKWCLKICKIDSDCPQNGNKLRCPGGYCVP